MSSYTYTDLIDYDCHEVLWDYCLENDLIIISGYSFPIWVSNDRRRSRSSYIGSVAYSHTVAWSRSGYSFNAGFADGCWCSRVSCITSKTWQSNG